MKVLLPCLSLALLTALYTSQQDPAPSEGIAQEELEALTHEIKQDIEKLRGRSFPRATRVAVTTKEEFLDYARALMEKESTPEEIAAEETVAKLLGLIPVDMDLVGTMLGMLESQVGGFYDPESESFYLMEAFSGGLAKVILAHELTHALDDQLYDIDGTRKRYEDNSDRVLAYHGVVEGSGTAVMNAWSMGHIRELAGLDLSELSSVGGDGEAPPYLWRPLMATYVRGSAFLNRTSSVLEGSMKMPSNEDFHTAFADPPRSTEQLLHPEKYWDAGAADEPVALAFDLGGLPAGWEVASEDTLGELHLACFVEEPSRRKGLPSSQVESLAVKFTSRAAEGWGGDRFVLLGRGEGRMCILETVWDTEDDAREFDAAMAKLQEHLEGVTTALAGGEGPAGVLRLFEHSGKAVTLVTWYGVERREVARVLAGVRVRVRGAE